MKNWPNVALTELLRDASDPVRVQQNTEYPNFGIFSFGRGLFAKPPISGMQTSASTLYRVRAGSFVYSRLFAFEGSYGLVDDAFDGHFTSNEYPSFTVDRSRLEPRFLKAYFQLPRVWQDIAMGSKGVGSRRIRVQPDRVLAHRIPLPSLSVQQAIVARLDALAEKTRQVEAHLDAVEHDAVHLLALRFRDVIAGAPLRPMAEVAPAVRRPVEIDIAMQYREVGARSFGKGLFVKPDFDGAEATWQKPVWIRAGDLVLSNIKAWEGAIAVATDEHHGSIASHRYITCVPDPARATASFLAYYLLSDDGLEKVGLASPGTADRNRTLSLGNLGKIEVPVPGLSVQQTFDRLQAEVAALKARHASIRQANASLIPATLERVFSSAACVDAGPAAARIAVAPAGVEACVLGD
jgi:type I restriction enzyme S subunit